MDLFCSNVVKDSLESNLFWNAVAVNLGVEDPPRGPKTNQRRHRIIKGIRKTNSFSLSCDFILLKL